MARFEISTDYLTKTLVDLLNGAMLAFFVVMTAVAFASPDSGLEKWIAVISTSWLGLVALTSLVIGKPFTLSYARVGVSPEIAPGRPSA